MSSFTQLGSDIDGEAVGDRAASVSLSSDGTILAVGGYKNDGNGDNSGHTRIYQWNSETNSWVQLGNDIDGEEAGDESGYSVSLSSDGTIVAIGSPQGVNSRYGGGGHVRIYQWDAGSSAWNKLGNTIPSPWGNTDDAGQSVSLSSDGNSIVVGSPGRGSAGPNWKRGGAAHVYDWNSGSNTWVKRGYQLPSSTELSGTGQERQEHGFSVSISSDGNIAAVGSPAIGYWGYAQVIAWNGSRWVQRGSDIGGEFTEATGYSVSLSSDGNTVAVGSIYTEPPGGDATNTGKTRIYAWDGSAWVQRGSDIFGEAASDLSGNSVSLSDDGKTVAIGAWQNDGNGSQAGHTRIYKWNESEWVQIDTDIDAEAAGDYSGWRVSLSGDGNTVAIGAQQNDGNGEESGHVRVFNLADKTAPTFSSAATSTDGTKIILTYDETLSSTTASTSAFTVSSGGVANPVTAVAISGSTVELTLTNTIKKSETITVAYSDPTSSNDANAVQDSSGNDAATLSAQSVTNNSTVAAISSSGGSTSNNASTSNNGSISNNDSNRDTESGNTLLLNDNNSFSVTTGASNGLWLTLKVLSASTSLQNTLILIDQNNNVLGSIGATQFSKNRGDHAIFIPEGSTISFQQSSNNQPINSSPQHTITQQSDGSYKLHLNDNTRDSDHDDLIIDISFSSASPDPSATSMASKQQNIHDAILDLSSIPADGQTLQITLNSDCAFINRFALVKLNQQSSGEFTVGGYNNTAGEAFDQNVYDSIINPGGSIITATGLQQQTFEWSLSATDAGFYAPVLINPAGDIHTYGSSHVKNLGSNLFAFEDDSQISNPDYDFNDLTAKFQIIT